MIGQNSDKNDPMEEFEFRPINEGLGFHRKQKSAAQPSFQSIQPLGSPSAQSEARPLNQNSSVTKTNTQPTFSTKASPFQTALPRHDLSKKSTAMQVPTIEDDSIANAQTAVNEILKTINKKRQLDFVTENEKQKILLKKSKPQLFASILDGMLIIAAFLMTLILMLSITKVDMILNLTHPATSGLVYFATLMLFVGVTFIYMVVNRAFLGYTPGEWAFDQVCGTEEDQDQVMYIPKIALRALVVIATGFITLPFLSYLFNKDVAGNIAGVNLFKKPYGV